MRKESFQAETERADLSRYSRKQFLRNSSILVAGSVLSPRHLHKAFGSDLHDIGIQLYSVRKEMLEDPIGTLKKIAAIGFKELESARSDKGNYYGLAPKEIKKISQDLGMKLRSGHIHIDDNWDKSLEQATETGQQYLISAILPSKGQTLSHYQESAETFNKIGEECKKAGLHFGYHNHDTEFESEDGKVLYDVLLERCDPSLVKMERDLGWLIASGHDPNYYFDKYPGRFELWHLKDMSKAERKSVEFGNGRVDIFGLLAQSRKSGMKYFFVEQEEYSVGPFQSMEYDYRYLVSHKP